jgi:CheY-like chemotaxis protein/signal transduction histidine kinase/CHASE3 domain sensor protein
MFNRLKIGTKIATGFAISLGILVLIGLISYYSINELIATSRKEKQTYQVLSQLQTLHLQIIYAESGQRGYLITGEQRYLSPYRNALTLLEKTFQDLEKLTLDSSYHQRNLDKLSSLINQRIAVMQNVINIRDNEEWESVKNALLTDDGKNLMDEISRIIQEMENTENLLLQQRSQKATIASQRTINSITYSIPIVSLILAVIGLLLTRHISIPLTQLSKTAENIADGNLSVSLPNSDREDEIGILTRTFNQMIANLQHITQKNHEQNWFNSNLADFMQMLQGQSSLENVSAMILSNLTPLVGAQQSVFYLMDEIDNEPILKLLSSYAYPERKKLANQFHLGEGLVGQCALEKHSILLTQVPDDYVRIHSGLGAALPCNIIVLPILFESNVIAVMELASLQPFSDFHLNFLEQLSEIIGVFLNNIAANSQTQHLLIEAQILTQELQSQQAELKHTNQSLEQQTGKLEASQLLLQRQQEELQQSNEELQQLNEELEEKAELLEIQNCEVARKNQEIERARQSLEEKAEQLALSSQYKSEFLANMSHELRTPLNSLLILARLLSDNSQGNLTEKQIEYSQTIYSAGNDLLELINDILDLAKIESGNFSLEIEKISLGDLQISLNRNFSQLADDKGISFIVELAENLPEVIENDTKRLQQILKNLLANAFKFTETGGVKLQISMSDAVATTENPMISFAVSDTGIGIPLEKQKIIFEAFQQVDGTTSRKYGGTGLGLSISRELAQLLGGRIELHSELGKGSIFTLYLPVTYAGNQPRVIPELNMQEKVVSVSSLRKTASEPILTSQPDEIIDDREQIQPGDRVLLIVEDDEKFARVFLEIARQQGFKVIVALQSKVGLTLAQHFKPDAIALDVHMAEMDGWTMLDRLKRDPETRHIPVHIISVDERKQRGLQLGAITYLQKPISPDDIRHALTEIKQFLERKVRNLLIVEDDPIQAASIKELIGNGDVESTAVNTGATALKILESQHFDCMVLDLGLPDMSGLELIEKIKQQSSLLNLPIIIYTGKELTRKENNQLQRLAETIIIKNVRSPERLLDETALFLHRVQANLPQPKRQILEQLRQTDPVLADRKILIIDDDLRNIFAITSFLESYQMEVLFAENGRDGIEILQAHPDINAILMDIMMPEMDGYETIAAIRQEPQFRTLPIIALTAKAMPGDRQQCIESGASDYITKPVDTEQLLSLLRVWLYQ